jgi:hypothetical protein
MTVKFGYNERGHSQQDTASHFIYVHLYAKFLVYSKHASQMERVKSIYIREKNFNSLRYETFWSAYILHGSAQIGFDLRCAIQAGSALDGLAGSQDQ